MVLISQKCFMSLLCSAATPLPIRFQVWVGYSASPFDLCLPRGAALLDPSGTEGSFPLKLLTVGGPRALTSLGPVKSPT